ncbi:hypothetical protein [Blastococcus sp. SYSU DS0533]
MAEDAGADPDGPRAEEVFEAALLPRPGGPLLHRARVAGAFVAGLFGGLLPAPSVHDVVVTRRADGGEVLRVPAGDPLAAGDVLQAVRTELGTLRPGEFLRAWDVR